MGYVTLTISDYSSMTLEQYIVLPLEPAATLYYRVEYGEVHTPSVATLSRGVDNAVYTTVENLVVPGAPTTQINRGLEATSLEKDYI